MKNKIPVKIRRSTNTKYKGNDIKNEADKNIENEDILKIFFLMNNINNNKMGQKFPNFWIISIAILSILINLLIVSLDLNSGIKIGRIIIIQLSILGVSMLNGFIYEITLWIKNIMWNHKFREEKHYPKITLPEMEEIVKKEMENKYENWYIITWSFLSVSIVFLFITLINMVYQ